jgi:gliding motility-associated-like protein
MVAISNYAYSYGYGCRDTVTKKNFLTILPPFSKITDVIKTCDGNRDVVKFVDGSRKGNSWKWKFGDGTESSFTTKPDTIAHRYAKSGRYLVYQEVTNGSCTLKDSAIVNIITKQKPVLSSSITELCSTGEIPIKINNLDTPWSRYTNSYYFGYDVRAVEFNGTPPLGANLPFVGGSPNWITELNGRVLYPYAGKDSFRVIIGADCLDTTNYIPVRVYGPKAGFFVTQPTPCFEKPITFTDTSKINFGKKIVQWEWVIENNTPLLKTNGASFTYAFMTPGSYSPRLKVTDEKGCTDQTYGYYPAIEVSGPKVDFTPSRTIVPPNSVVNFSNTSNEGPFYWYTTQYKWIYPDGSTAIDRNGSFNFTTEGVFSVKLIGTNSYTGCSDTIVKTITVRKVNSAFTYTTTYTNTNGCPPAMVRFTSTATNVSSYGWSFGDGSIAGNQKIANHTYNEAGVYRVVHYAYDANGGVDSTEDYIEIKGPYALLKTNDFFACNSFEVRLAAEVKNASKFTWDFGDGTLVEGKDTTATHRYATPGIYTPALILEDATGCKTTSLMPEKIVVDSLQADFSISPARVCLGTPIFFGGIYNSYAQSRLQQPLQQRWIVSSPANAILTFDTLANINYRFLSPGLHTVTLAVSSLCGCRDTVVKTINVQPAINAAIVAIPAICQGDSLGFATTVAPNAGSLSWRWTIPGQPSFTTASTSKLAWPTAGTFNISAVADNGLCADSATATLTVHAKPNLQLTAVDKHLCLGDSLLLNATGAPTVQWRSHPTQLPQSGNAIKVFPKVDTWYLANGISSQGCQTADSVMVKVAQPIAISPKTSTVETCQNVPVNLGVGGAPNYEWLPTTGLSNSRIANPVANPPSNTTYTVVGFDGVGCFTDTATVRVLVNAVPKVDVGPNLSVLSGSTVTLNATASLTVATWLWQPATYLSCTNCASPIAAPKTDMVYTAKATTAKGCAASDTLSIKILCDESRIYLPTGFTPNGDNLNDRFGVLGGGIKTIRSFVVMDRWGKVVFERKMANPTDRNSSWDGSRNGEPAPLGAYVYMLEVECDGGQVFGYKGTVMLVR